MKLIVRADDVGYTKVCNIGTFEAIENGIVTAADIMLDTPGTVDALERLRCLPWISVGWHAHFWGSPLLGADKVPSMYDATRKGFRKDLFTANDVVYEEVISECRAQIDLCIKILGRAPDVGGVITKADSPFCEAILQVHEDYNIITDYMSVSVSGRILENPKASDKWADKKIAMSGFYEAYRAVQADENGIPFSSYTDSISALEKYDPIKYYVNDEGNLLDLPKDVIAVNAWHPGYVDYFVCRSGDFSPAAKCFREIRTVDVHALCSQEVKDWIKNNSIELINFRDALFETREYQNHLHAMGSELAISR
jgi:predicted glycoside hydrolase/deacetylase ChbG (UPF0249 family)